jgi:hypothetical protein
VTRACPLGRCGSTRHCRAGSCMCSPSFLRCPREDDRPSRLASHEVLFPYNGRRLRRAVRVQRRTSDDPASAFQSRFPQHCLPCVMQAAARAAVDGPCGFSLTSVVVCCSRVSSRSQAIDLFPRRLIALRCARQSHVTDAGRGVMHRQFLRGDVPLPAYRGLSQPCRKFQLRRRSWGLPFAVLFLPASGPMFPSRRRSHVPFSERPYPTSDYVCRVTNRLFCVRCIH